MAERGREQYRRIHGLNCADLGNSLAAQTNADEAISTWIRTLDLTEGSASDRTRKAFISIRPTLVTYLKRGVPGAADLYGRMYETRH